MPTRDGITLPRVGFGHENLKQSLDFDEFFSVLQEYERPVEIPPGVLAHAH